jgi:hypothetical protein
MRQKVMPMTRLAFVCTLVCGAVVHISAQDPTRTLPDAYKVQFENDYARVIRVHYEAGAKLPEHTHPPGTTVYVYLNDSEGVVFAHSGRSNRAVTRPAVMAGGVRIASGPEEHHTAENPAATPSDFLRIVFKTDDGGERNLRRRLSLTDKTFTNNQMRITRRAGEGVVIETPANTPALLVSIPFGDVRWFDGGERVTLPDAGEFLQIDFLTPPK